MVLKISYIQIEKSLRFGMMNLTNTQFSPYNINLLPKISTNWIHQTKSDSEIHMYKTFFLGVTVTYIKYE